MDNRIVIKGQEYQLSGRKNNDDTWCRRVILEQDVVVPSESQCDVSTKAVFNFVHQEPIKDESWSTEPAEVKEGLLVASTILPNRACDIPVRVMNTTKQSIKLNRGTIISDVHCVEPLTGSQKPTKEVPTNESLVEEMMSKVDTSVPEHIRTQLRQL